MIAIVDYGMGNLRSVEKALERIGERAEITNDHARLRAAAALVLPGVGAFPKAMEEIRRLELDSVLTERVHAGVPVLGICLGMQLLFEESEEFGPVAGLGVLPGRVVRFPADRSLKVPHMGWNTLRRASPAPVLDGIQDGAYVYFVHSYYPVPADPGVIATTTPYGDEFASSVARDNVFACQFHPEKSQRVGLTILQNFVELAS